MIRAFEQHMPEIAASAWVDDTALVSGDVNIGADSSVWPMSVVRGDVNYIRIGERSNIQDGSVLHVTHGGEFTSADGLPLIIGDDVTVGHKVILHACTIQDTCLIGMGSIVMDGVTVEAETLVGAGTLVPPGKTLTGRHLWMGNPAKCIRPLSDREREYLAYSAAHYVRLATRTRHSDK